jgi:hypothetical protein
LNKEAGYTQIGSNTFLLPYNEATIEEKIDRILSTKKEGVMCSANEYQNFSSVFAEDLSLLPTETLRVKQRRASSGQTFTIESAP